MKPTLAFRILIYFLSIGIMIPLGWQTPGMHNWALAQLGNMGTGNTLMGLATEAVPVVIKWLKEQESISGSKNRATTIDTGLKDPKRIVAESELDIQVQEWNSTWYGSIVVKLNSKPKVNYILDLSKIELSLDSNEVTLCIPQPLEQQVISDNAATTAEYTGVRKWFGADTRQALESKVRDECNAKSTDEAKKNLKGINLELQKKLEEEFGKAFQEKDGKKLKVVLKP
jgi:hypothetical protein